MVYKLRVKTNHNYEFMVYKLRVKTNHNYEF